MAQPTFLKKILLTRPEPAATETEAALAMRGYDVVSAPALVMAARSPRAIANLTPETLLVVTSPQAARALAYWPELKRQQALAVGTATGKALKKSGFKNVDDVDGDVNSIVAALSGGMARDIIIACAPTTAQTLARKLNALGHHARRVTVYDIAPAGELSAEAIRALRGKKISHVLFYSARTVETFLSLAKDANIMENLAQVTACCLSAKVARAVKKGKFAKILVAARPNGEALQHLLPAID